LADYWTGKPSDDLVTSWGEPSKIKERSGGTRVFAYKLRFQGEREVDAPCWYIDERNRSQNASVPPQSETGATMVPPAVVIPGPVGTKKVTTKMKVRFFIDVQAD
jgi:hypothetical protein